MVNILNVPVLKDAKNIDVNGKVGAAKQDKVLLHLTTLKTHHVSILSLLNDLVFNASFQT